jgi:choline dehydrogenase-like flavoprotein
LKETQTHALRDLPGKPRWRFGRECGVKTDPFAFVPARLCSKYVPMLIDLCASGSPSAIEADLCIVGSGPAGLVIAAEFVNSAARVCVLEAGGDAVDAGSREPCAGSVDPPNGYSLETLRQGRAWQFGGSANLWNHRIHGGRPAFVRCLTLDEIDFEKRAWVPESGWPFSKRDLQPFYERAQRIFGIGSEDLASNWSGDAERRPWVAGEVEAIVSQFCAAQGFLKDFKERLAAAENVKVLLHADLRRLTLDPLSRAIVSAEVEPPDGGKVTVTARRFVLAAGGLENPRILLLNDAPQSGGLGNQHDLVGRYFMDHPAITLGTIRPSSPALFEASGFFDQHFARGRSIMGLLRIREEVMRREEMLNLCGALVPYFKDLGSILPTFWPLIAAETGRAVRRSLKALYLRAFPRPKVGAHSAGSLIEGCYEVNRTGWSRIARKSQRFGVFAIRSLVEQAPDAANRVMLGETRDRFGQRNMKVVWRWNEADLRSIRLGQAIFAREMTAAGIGQFTPVAESTGAVRRPFWSPNHFMGTTRMHREERRGVVDQNCRVHGIPNLFIAGSSVFPTGGFANPTLTIVALALRLADHLKERSRGAA